MYLSAWWCRSDNVVIKQILSLVLKERGIYLPCENLAPNFPNKVLKPKCEICPTR